MTSVPATELPDGTVTALPRPAPHVRTYLLPCVLSVVLFFPTAIPGIVHGGQGPAARPRAATRVTRGSKASSRGSGSG